MITNGVKITQSNGGEFGVGSADVFQDFFDHVFGAAVRVSDVSAGRHIFSAFGSLGITIDGSGRRENDFLHMIILHTFKQIDGAGEIVLIVHDGFFDGLVDGFEAGEMYN